MDNQLPFVSVIIPTYHDWNRLSFCINALKKQTYPKNQFEVVIINNDPSDPFPYGYLPDNFILITEGEVSSYAARNAGIKSAKGELFAFTDSDAIPSGSWLQSGVDLIRKLTFNRKGPIIIGNVAPFNEEDLNLFGLFDKITSFKPTFKTWNLFISRDVFHEVGLFNEKLISGGDFEWGERAAQKGFIIIHSKETVVCHPLRNSLASLLKKQVRVGYGSGQRLKLCYLGEITSYGILIEGIKEVGRLPKWISWVLKSIWEAHIASKISLWNLVELIPIVIMFGVATSYGRMQAICRRLTK